MPDGRRTVDLVPGGYSEFVYWLICMLVARISCFACVFLFQLGNVCRCLTMGGVKSCAGVKAWTRLEAMCMYTKSIMMQEESPEIWVAAVILEGRGGKGGKRGLFLERFDYVLSPTSLPSKGVLFSDGDRASIEGHEKRNMEQIKAIMSRNGYISRHAVGVDCVCFDPKDADYVASAGSDGLKLVRRDKGKAVWSIQNIHGASGVGGGVTPIAFNREGTLLASGGHDQLVRLWDVSGAAPVERFAMEGHYLHGARWVNPAVVTCVALSHDGGAVASGSFDRTVRLWDARSGKAKAILGHSKDNSDCSCRHLASAEGNYPDGYRADIKCQVRGHAKKVRCVAFNHDGTVVASGSDDLTVKLWDASSGELKTTLKGHSDVVQCVAFNHDRTVIASGSDDCTVKLWDASSGELKATLDGHSNTVSGVSFNHDGAVVASGSKDNSVHAPDWARHDPKRQVGPGWGGGQQDCPR